MNVGRSRNPKLKNSTQTCKCYSSREGEKKGGGGRLAFFKKDHLLGVGYVVVGRRESALGTGDILTRSSS